jgi:hypothetical protein
MSIRKQTRKSREIGMHPVRPLVEFSVSSAECRMTARSVSFCSDREASQSEHHFTRDGGLGSACPARNVPGRVRCLQRATRGNLKPRSGGLEWIFARASTAKVMLNREVTAVPSDRDWTRSAWLTKRRRSAGPLERDAGGMKASRPSTCQ